jgi:hypothetical protein
MGRTPLELRNSTLLEFFKNLRTQGSSIVSRTVGWHGECMILKAWQV